MAKVKHRVGIKGSIKSIYDCLTTSDGLAGWWATSASGVAVEGGNIKLGFSGLAVLTFRFEKLNVHDLVILQCVSGPGPWQGSSLQFELQKTEQQIFVTFTHKNENSSEDDFLYFSTKWPIYLLSLKELIETGTGKPYPQDIKIHLGD